MISTSEEASPPLPPSKTKVRFALAVGLAVLLRILIDIALWRAGYRFGDDPDTYWRLGLSWRWAQTPFLTFGYWVPLQFWIVGATFRILELLHMGASIIVPVIWNHLFFIGSLVALYLTVRGNSGEAAAVAALLIASMLTSDVWVTYSGVSEPLIVLAGMVITLSFAAYVEHPVPRPSRYLFLASMAAAVASATHYIGWYLCAFMLAFLVYLAVSLATRGLQTQSGHLLQIALCGLIVVAVPSAWILINLIKYGDPLHFLATAQSYHTRFAGQALEARLASSAIALWKAEPAILIAAAMSLPVVAVRNRRVLLCLLPAAAYFGLLTFSALMSYGVPEMHVRYSLLTAWLLIPLIASALGGLLTLRAPVVAGVASAALVAFLASDAVRAFRFRNWMDPTAIQVAALVEERIRQTTRPLNVIVEQQPCLFPMAGIANSVSRPDWTRLVDSDRINGLAEIADVPFPGFDLAVLTNPLTIRALQDVARPVAFIGDYAILAPGRSLPSSQPALPVPWVPLRSDQFLSVNQDGTIYFSFTSQPNGAMEQAGIQATFATLPGACYILSADIEDWYEKPAPTWTILQQLIVNSVVLWSHDVAGTGDCWQRLDHYIVATSDQLDIELAAVVAGPGAAPVEWSAMSLTGIRGLQIAECR